MKTIRIREIEIGAGMPKICVPVTGVTVSEILEQTAQAVEKQPDLLEWRADFFESLTEPEKVHEMAGKMRDILKNIPMIFTVRTSREGGNCHISTEDYISLLSQAAENPEIDLIDVELYRDVPQMKVLIARLKEKGKKVIASNHHFDRTPVRTTMERILAEMDDSGADIRKLAVMPGSPENVLDLLYATSHANWSGKAPVITMSMGSLGSLSRISGQIFGSAVTFGTVGEASAPGQLAIDELRIIMKILKL